MLRVTTVMTGLAGAPYYSNQYFQGVDGAQAIQSANAVRAWWDALKGYITNGLTITVQPEVDEVDPTTGFTTETWAATPAQVLSTGNAPLPKATQGVARLKTSTFFGGRRLQGRIFIPALANDAQLNGVPSAAFVGAIQTAGTALMAGGGGGNDLVIYSRKNLAAADVTSVTAWNQFGVMRSRRD